MLSRRRRDCPGRSVVVDHNGTKYDSERRSMSSKTETRKLLSYTGGVGLRLGQDGACRSIYCAILLLLASSRAQ